VSQDLWVKELQEFWKCFGRLLSLVPLQVAWASEEVMQEYELTKEEVEAAFTYAADLVTKTGVVSLEGS
jgi:hypothetical protein